MEEVLHYDLFSYYRIFWTPQNSRPHQMPTEPLSSSRGDEHCPCVHLLWEITGAQTWDCTRALPTASNPILSNPNHQFNQPCWACVSSEISFVGYMVLPKCAYLQVVPATKPQPFTAWGLEFYWLLSAPLSCVFPLLWSCILWLSSPGLMDMLTHKVCVLSRVSSL